MLDTFLLVSLFNKADPIPVKNFKALLVFRADRIAKYPVSEEITSEINTSQAIKRDMNQIQNPKQTEQYRNLFTTLFLS